MSEKPNKLAGTVGVVMAIMLAGKITGLARDILLRRAYGTEGIEAQALALATNIPRNFLDFAFASVISASFIPVFNQYLVGKSREDAFKLAHGFITLILLATAGFTALGALFAPQVAAFFAPGYSAEAYALSVRLLRVMMLTVFLSGAAFSLTGVLQSLGEFNAPAAMSVASNLLIIGYLLIFSERLGVYGLCAAFVVGWVTQSLIQIPPLVKRGYRFRPKLMLRDDGMKAIFKLMPPVLVGSWVVPMNTLVNQRVASHLFEGAGAAVIDTANQLYAVVTGVVILSVSNVVFPRLAKQQAGGDDAGFSDTLRGAIRALMFFLLPMTLGLIAIAEPLTRLLFEGGRFDALATSRTAYALAAYAPGMVGFGLQTVLSRGFFARRDGWTPMLTGLLAMVANVTLSYGLAGRFGVGGVAAAASVSITMTGVIMLVVMQRRSGGVWDGRTMIAFVKMLACAAAMYAAAAAVSRAIGDGGLARRVCAVALPTCAGVLVYMGLAYAARIDEARLAFGRIKRGKR